MGIYAAEHRLLQESVRKFCDAEITPNIRGWEEQRWFPSELFQKLGDNGFLGLRIPEEWGGVGGDLLMAGAWCEEFGRTPSVGLTTAVNMHSLVITPTLCQLGSAVAKERWVPSAVTGTAIGAYAFTEPGAGSDLTVIQTKAVRDGDHYVINGAKTFITNGARASFILVLTRTSTGGAYEGYTTFVVDTSLPGFSVSKKLEKLGWHCSDTAELSFNDLRVHHSCVLGKEGEGWLQAMRSLEWERLMLSLGALGGARACLEATIGYVNDRTVFGRSVGSYSNNRSSLFDYYSRLEGCRALCHRCLLLLEQGQRCRKEVSLAKLLTCELAIEIADACLQLHGGYGYTTEFLPERWLRDLRLNTIGGGTSQIMARTAAKEIFGKALGD